MIAIDEKKCTGCGSCVMACPNDALSVWIVAKVNENCNDCQECIYHCHVDAIEEK